MSLSPLNKLLKALAFIIGLLLALVGVVFFISGLQAYISNEAVSEIPFEKMLFAVGFLGIPATGFFLYKARMSFRRGRNDYGLPDAPSRSMILAALTISASIVTIASFVIVLVVF